MTPDNLQSFQVRYNSIMRGHPTLKMVRLDTLKMDLEDAYGNDMNSEVQALYMDVLEERRG